MISFKTCDVTKVLLEPTAPHPFNFIVIKQRQSTSSLPTSSPLLSNDTAQMGLDVGFIERSRLQYQCRNESRFISK